jgi:hypothetical protein
MMSSPEIDNDGQDGDGVLPIIVWAALMYGAVALLAWVML